MNTTDVLKYGLRQFVTAEARAGSAVDLDEHLKRKVVAGAAAEGYSPVEPPTVTWIAVTDLDVARGDVPERVRAGDWEVRTAVKVIYLP